MIWLRIKRAFTGRPIVLLYDFDGDTTPVLAYRVSDGRWFADRHGFSIHTVELGRDGSVIDGSYVKRWTPLYGELDFPPGDGRPEGWTEALALGFMAFAHDADGETREFAQAFCQGEWGAIQDDWPEFDRYVRAYAR